MVFSRFDIDILNYLIRNQSLEKCPTGLSWPNWNFVVFIILLADSMCIKGYFYVFSDIYDCSAFLYGKRVQYGFIFASCSQSIYFISFIDSKTIFAILLSPNMFSIVSKGDLNMSAK